MRGYFWRRRRRSAAAATTIIITAVAMVRYVVVGTALVGGTTAEAGIEEIGCTDA